MLGLQGVDDAMTRPMTAQVDGKQIWFFAAKSEDLVKGLQRSNRAIATYASKNHKIFASIHGTLTESYDRGVLDRLWNPIIDSWYKDGKDDPDLAMLRFDTDHRRRLGSRYRRDAQSGLHQIARPRPRQAASGRKPRRGGAVGGDAVCRCGAGIRRKPL